LLHPNYYQSCGTAIVRSTAPSATSLSSHASRECSSGIARVDWIISEVADESRTGAASLKIEIARNMMHEGDYKGCARHIDSAMRALK
jgi:hypothetical protein